MHYPRPRADPGCNVGAIVRFPPVRDSSIASLSTTPLNRHRRYYHHRIFGIIFFSHCTCTRSLPHLTRNSLQIHLAISLSSFVARESRSFISQQERDQKSKGGIVDTKGRCEKINWTFTGKYGNAGQAERRKM